MANASDSWKPLPTQQVLLALFRYDPETGRLFWRERPISMFPVKWQHKTWNSRWVGKEAFTAINKGYQIGNLFGQMVSAHRVVWKLVHGNDANGQIDHINGDRRDNRVDNLRVVDDAENRKNQSLPKDNTSGRIGVSWSKAAHKWKAEICLSGRRLHLGVFEKLEDAAAARSHAERLYGFHKNHGKIP